MVSKESAVSALVVFGLCVLSAQAAPKARCEAFCKKAAGLCKGEDAAYDNMADCLTSCGKSSVPAVGDIVGANSLPCREFWIARVAAQKEATGFIPPGLCDYAAEGGGMCDPSVAPNCDAYCGQLGPEGDCGRGSWNQPEQQCEAACRGFKQAATDAMRGDSLQCRILYINIGEQSQLADAKSKFCPNAGVTSGMCKAGKPEKSECQDYCDWNKDFCASPETTRSHETTPECLSYCRNLNPEQLKCHLKYVAVAARSTVPQVPCMHREACAVDEIKRLDIFATAPFVGAEPASDAVPEDEDESEDEM